MSVETRENLPVVMSAGEYHRYMSNWVGPWDELLISRLTAEFRPAATSTIIDMGTGTAVIPIKLAAIPQFDGASVIAMDFFRPMVEAAREAVQAAGVEDRIHVVRADAHRMPFADGCADYLISRSTLHHLKDPAQAFREVFRILRPGGIALIHDPRRDPNPEFLKDFNERRRQAGFEPNDLSEKFTLAQVRGFVEEAGVAAFATIHAPSDGPASMGYEVRVEKPAS